MDEDMMAAAGRFWIFTFVISLILVGFLGGSFRTEVTLTPETAVATGAGKTFEEDLSARHWLGGLVQGQQANLQEALARHTGGGNLTQLSVITKHTWSDLLVSFFTLWVYCPKTVTIRGRVEPAQTLTDVTQVLPTAQAAAGEETTLQP